jgi:hypothetical protein
MNELIWQKTQHFEEEVFRIVIFWNQKTEEEILAVFPPDTQRYRTRRHAARSIAEIVRKAKTTRSRCELNRRKSAVSTDESMGYCRERKTIMRSDMYKHPRLFDDKCPQGLRVLNAQVVDPNDASSDQ